MERRGALRHGWGGDKKLRRQFLRDKADEETERRLFPEKYGETVRQEKRPQEQKQ